MLGLAVRVTLSGFRLALVLRWEGVRWAWRHGELGVERLRFLISDEGTNET